jgi:CRISPR system Cascade subunit CasB
LLPLVALGAGVKNARKDCSIKEGDQYMPENNVYHFIDYLYTLAKKEDRGALATLRRGLGQPPGTVTEMFRYVIPHLPNDRRQERACFLIAPLFALHPKIAESGNMGAHLARTRTEAGEEALERRFTALLSAHADDLAEYLRQAVSFLKSKEEIPVNWNQLFWDILNWDDEDRRVQKEWARAFWSRPQPAEQ